MQRTLDGHRYVVFVPSSPPPELGYPLVLFLHSAGQRGTDGEQPLDFGIGPALRRRVDSFPGIVVFPQADYADGPILETWREGEPGGDVAHAVLADVEAQWPVDPSKRAITGWSMGAYGTLSLAAADPQAFSRVLAISGGGEAEWGPALSELPVWIIHGDRDAIVPVSESRSMAEAVPAPHNRLRYTEVSGAGHDLWRSVYDNQDVLDWLLASDEVAPPNVTFTVPDEHGTADETEDESRPFNPALVISRAMSLRLGNEALQTLADGVPRTMADEGIHGALPPVKDSVEFDGNEFDVHFRDMSYRGHLVRAVLAGRAAGRLQVAIAIKNLVVRIGAIEVSNQTDGVITEEVLVTIGHRDPVWLDLEVRPAATSDGRLRLVLLRSEFTISDNNWFVTPPGDMVIRGELFSKPALTTAIVGGVYQRKAVIEEKILGAVESILQQVERRADFSPLSRLVTALWPLPVYRPRVQVQLEETAADANGVSLVFGCVVDGPGGASSSPTRRVAASIPSAPEVESASGLQAAVSVDVVQHLSALLAGTDAMSIYAADVPGRPFRELDDVAGMEEALGASTGPFSDVRTRLKLAKPFMYTPMDRPGDAPGTIRMAIDVPDLNLTIFVRDNAADGTWTPVAERTLQLQQPLRLQALPELDGPTHLSLAWDAETTMSVLDDNVSYDENDPLLTDFQRGWSRWAASQQQALTVPDVAVGSSMLRLQGFDWQGECLAAQFGPAPTILVNATNRSVAYCIRSEHSRWSRPQVLPPRTQHIYRNGVTLQVRDADRWARDGQPLGPGFYDWSTEPDMDGRRWIARRQAPAGEIPTPPGDPHSKPSQQE